MHAVGWEGLEENLVLLSLQIPRLKLEGTQERSEGSDPPLCSPLPPQGPPQQ